MGGGTGSGRLPIHDDIQVAAVPLKAGTHEDVVSPGEANLHREVGHQLGLGLQRRLQVQQHLFGLLPGGYQGSFPGVLPDWGVPVHTLNFSQRKPVCSHILAQLCPCLLTSDF